MMPQWINCGIATRAMSRGSWTIYFPLMINMTIMVKSKAMSVMGLVLVMRDSSLETNIPGLETDQSL